MRGILVGAVFTLAMASFVTGSAQGAIRCNGAFQINSQGEFHSPYCEDGYLAQVARTFGWRVSGDQIRANYGLKAEICRAIGFDSRILETCSQYRSQNRGNRHCKFLPC
jgi:hypothetical protein